MDDELHLRGVDAPRQVPAAARARLDEMLRSQSWHKHKHEHALARAIEFEALFEGIDAPRPLPAASRARLATELRAVRATVVQRALGIAAVLLLLASTGVIVFRPSETRAPDVAQPTLPPSAPGEFHAPQPPPDTSAGRGSGGVAGGSPAVILPEPAAGPAPPFAFAGNLAPGHAPPPPMSGGSGSTDVPSPRPAPPPKRPLRIGIVEGNQEIEAGFTRYIALLNQAGGLRNHPVRLVEVSGDRPAGRSILATVNLSTRALADDGPPAWTSGPLLESLEATQPVQHGSVRSFASPPERQAHLIADQMYPTPVEQPTTAVIYHESDQLFGEVLPDAIETALEERGVTALRVEYDPSSTPLFLPADAAFLSLRTDAAERWLIDSDEAGYQPARGIGGVYTLMAPRLGRLMEGRNVRMISPYARASGPEVEAMTGTDATYSDERAHGWLTAKSIAVSVWLHGATDSASMRRAIARLTGYDTIFTPPYEIRGSSNARTPEGMLFAFEDGQFVARSEFLRDPF